MIHPRAALVLFHLHLVLIPVGSPGGDWPQWRGPRRDGHAAPGETLPASLREGLQPVWRQVAGGGFASPIVASGRVILLDEQNGRETARSLDAATGEEQWRTPYAPVGGDEWGQGPRCTPIADSGRVYVQSLRGEFACLDLADGRRLWGFSFERDYGARWEGGNDASDSASRRRGHSGAPVVVGDRIYVAVGATNGASIVCFNKGDGREIWRSLGDETAYAALMTGSLGSREQLVAFTAAGLVGLDLDRGETLWRVPLKTAANRHAVTPILHRGGDVIVSSHTLGLRTFQVAADGAGFRASAKWSQATLKTSLATLVEVDGFLYGQGPDRDLHCVEAATGEVKWSQHGFGEKPLVGYSSTLAAGGRLLVLTDDGQLVLLAADPGRYAELGRAQVCGKTWSHPALAGGRLFLRDRRELFAFDLTATPSEPRRP